MSFRRRGDVIQGRRPIAGAPTSNVLPNRNNVPGTKPKDTSLIPEFSKPSTSYSNLNCTSCGSSDLDNLILKHGGIPFGTSMLISEAGSTDFSIVLIKRFISNAVIQNKKKPNSNFNIVIGMPNTMATELPDLYVSSSSKERKKRLVKENEGKISVSNLAENKVAKDMKIAWRYTHNPSTPGLNNKTANEDTDYVHDLDITKHVRPAPGPNEIAFINISTYPKMLSEIESIIERQIKMNPLKNIKISMPYFLHPLIYGVDDLIDVQQVVSYVYGLKQLLTKFKENVVLMTSINQELFQDTKLFSILRDLLFDSVIDLIPFNHELNNLMEKTYKTQREKILQGYVNIHKISILSNFGMMEKHEMEFAFKNGKSKFHVEPWSIPVEEEDLDTKETF